MKVTKQMRVVVQRVDGVDGHVKATGDNRLYAFGRDRRYSLGELLPCEQKMVVGLKPGQRRVVDLVASWKGE